MGFAYIEIPGDGHCLYRAVGLYVGHDPRFLRNIVAAHLGHNKQAFADFINLPEGKSLDDYIDAIRNSKEWADNIEIEILMRLLDRPILIIGPNHQIINLNDKERFKGEPIYVHYNGHNHYDGLVLKKDLSAKTILEKLQKVEDELENKKELQQSTNNELGAAVTSQQQPSKQNENSNQAASSASFLQPA